MLMRTVAIAIFCVAFADQSRAEKTIGQYWAETGISLDTIDSLVNQTRCEKPNGILPCIEALNAISGFSSSPASVALKSVVQGFPDLYAAALKDFGPLEIVKASDVTSDQTSKAQRYAQTRKWLAAKAAAGKALEGSRQIPWSDVLAYVKSLPIKDAEKALAASTAVNAYYGAIYDPHTHLDSRGFNQDMQKDQSFSGIGAQLRKVGQGLVIDRPMEDSPAEKAGAYPEDEITAVDDKPVTGEAMEDVISRIRGPAGTHVALTIKRKGATITLDIVRQNVVTPIVKSLLIQGTAGQYGYVKLAHFMSSQACDRIAQALADFDAAGARGVVFDLRGNGGGLLDQAVCIGSLFIGEAQHVVGTRSISDGVVTGQMQWLSGVLQDGTVYVGTDSPIFHPQSAIAAPHVTKLPMTNLPTIVLVDAGSASASEIVSGALQDRAAAANLPIWVAGVRSFGKGSVQSVSSIAPAELGNIKDVQFAKTIARFYQPSGRTNQVLGIVPDVTIDPKPNATPDDLVFYREEDLYTNALPSVSIPWQEPRAADAARLQACAANGRAKQAYADHASDQIRPDYQRLVAIDVLDCGLAGPSAAPLR